MTPFHVAPRRMFGAAAPRPARRTAAAAALCACLLATPHTMAQAVLAQAAANAPDVLGTWYSQRSRERLSFGRNGELWSCFEGKAKDKVARGYWKELAPGRFKLYFTHIGLADCSFVGARERRMQVAIEAIAAINGLRLELFNSGEFPPDVYARQRRPN